MTLPPSPEAVTQRSTDLPEDVPGQVGASGLRRLLAAGQAVAGAPGLAEVLAQVVRSARELVGADDAALEVPQGGGGASRFVVLGSGDGRVDGLERPSWAPLGHVSTPLCMVLTIRVEDRDIATLFVAGQPDGVLFDNEDRALLLAFAGLVGVPIDHARRFEQSARRQLVLESTARITGVLLTEVDSPAVLRSVMAEGRLLVDADSVLVTRPMGVREETLHALAAVGDDAERWAATTVPLAGTITLYAAQLGLVVSADLQADRRFPQDRTRYPGVGALIAAPVRVHGETVAVLLVTRDHCRERFTVEEQQSIADFCEHVGEGVERARARVDKERVRLVSDRDRIARDVHDHVIGRLVGSGMAVQRLSRWISDDAGHRLLVEHIDELDDVIRDLRTLIYGLDHDPGEVWLLPSRVRRVVDEARLHLGFVPALQLDLEPDVGSGTALPGFLLAVLREALANVARHANAQAVQVRLVAGDTIDLTVTDDGDGLPEHRSLPSRSGGHGLHNMAERARALGGTCRLARPPGGGTTVFWSVPTPR